MIQVDSHILPVEARSQSSKENTKNKSYTLIATCEFCDEYNGFVVMINLKRKELRKFKKSAESTMEARMAEYEWSKQPLKDWIIY